MPAAFVAGSSVSLFLLFEMDSSSTLHIQCMDRSTSARVLLSLSSRNGNSPHFLSFIPLYKVEAAFLRAIQKTPLGWSRGCINRFSCMMTYTFLICYRDGHVVPYLTSTRRRCDRIILYMWNRDLPLSLLVHQNFSLVEVPMDTSTPPPLRENGDPSLHPTS